MAGEVVPIRTSGSASQSSFQEQDGSTWVKFAPGQSPHNQNGGNGGGDMSDWKQSVEDRLTDLRDDYRSLFRYGIGAVAFLLVAGGVGYNELRKDVATAGSSIAAANGKLDVILDQLSNESQRGD